MKEKNSTCFSLLKQIKDFIFTVFRFVLAKTLIIKLNLLYPGILITKMIFNNQQCVF